MLVLLVLTPVFRLMPYNTMVRGHGGIGASSCDMSPGLHALRHPCLVRSASCCHAACLILGVLRLPPQAAIIIVGVVQLVEVGVARELFAVRGAQGDGPSRPSCSPGPRKHSRTSQLPPADCKDC
jgi:hypothetical protein